MDKILSARLDEAMVSRIGFLAQRLRTSKKRVIEEAIRLYAGQVEAEGEFDVFDRTFGAWKRKRKGARDIEAIRAAFHNSMTRRQK